MQIIIIVLFIILLLCKYNNIINIFSYYKNLNANDVYNMPCLESVYGCRPNEILYPLFDYTGDGKSIETEK